MLSVTMLNVFVLNVIVLNDGMLSVIMLNVFMLTVFTLNGIVLSVVYTVPKLRSIFWCHNAEFYKYVHYAECCYDKSLYAKCHNAEWRCIECHFTDCQIQPIIMIS
jgi:hypothetical protein